MFVPLYRYSLREARRLGEIDEWKESHAENVRCRDTIDAMVAERYRNNILPHDIIVDACKEFGINRVGWVLATTVTENDYDGRYGEENKQWARTAFYLPKEERCCEYELRSHPVLIDGFAGYYRNYLYKDLGILTRDACLPDSNGKDYTDQLLIMSCNALAEDYKKGEFQYFYAQSGFGCSPTASGRKVFGFFVSDGEKAQFVRGDFIGIADPEKVPEWVNENLDKYLHGQENSEDGGMKLE